MWKTQVNLFLINSTEGNSFIYDIRFHGVNFPADGPVMQKKKLPWGPSTEKMYVRDGTLKGDVAMPCSWRRWPLLMWFQNYLQVSYLNSLSFI